MKAGKLAPKPKAPTPRKKRASKRPAPESEQAPKKARARPAPKTFVSKHPLSPMFDKGVIAAKILSVVMNNDIDKDPERYIKLAFSHE